MSRIDLDNPPEECRLYVELYERTHKEREQYRRENDELRRELTRLTGAGFAAMNPATAAEIVRERDEARAEVERIKIENRTLRNVAVARDEECERIRPVYEAARAWSKFGRDDADDENDLLRAVRAASHAPSAQDMERGG